MLVVNRLMSLLVIVSGLAHSAMAMAMQIPVGKVISGAGQEDDEKEREEPLGTRREQEELHNGIMGMAMLAHEAVGGSLTTVGLSQEDFTLEASRTLQKAARLVLAIHEKEKLVDAWSVAQDSLNYLVGAEQANAIKPLGEKDRALNAVLQGLTQCKIDDITQGITNKLQRATVGDEPVLRLVINLLMQNDARPWRRNVVTALQKSVQDIEADISVRESNLRLLIENGRDCNVSAGENKINPLLFAVREGRASLVDFLLEKKAIVDMADAQGNTPLMMAIQSKQSDMVSTLLLVGGADPDLKNAHGSSARDMAMVNDEMREVVESACAMRAEMQTQQESTQENQ